MSDRALEMREIAMKALLSQEQIDQVLVDLILLRKKIRAEAQKAKTYLYTSHKGMLVERVSSALRADGFGVVDTGTNLNITW
jgi:hypothetical protein